MGKTSKRSAFQHAKSKRHVQGTNSSKVGDVLDVLTRRVYHINFSLYRTPERFKIGVTFMMLNLEELSRSLRRCRVSDRRIRRRAEDLRLKAERMLMLYRSVPESLDDLEGWPSVAEHIIANYEMLRFEAGHLYQLVVPSSPFGVLRSAL
jgi:hypothetical protein